MEPTQTTGALHYVEHFLLVGIGIALPFFLTNFPTVANLTIGAILSTLLDYLKHTLTA